jgi:hypothetical protein
MATPISPEMRMDFDTVVTHLGTRAEDLSDPAATFVETIFPSVLRARQHHVIYGRRGVGKTHLLRRFESELTRAFEIHRAVPVYLNGSQLSQEITLLSSDPSMTALTVYVQVMDRLAQELHAFVRGLNQTTYWERVFGNKRAQVAQQADAAASLLQETLRRGQVRFLPTGEASEEASTLAETSKAAGAQLSAKLSDPRTLGWAVGADLSASTLKRLSSSTTRKIRSEVILPFNVVSNELRALLSLLGDATLVVLFDEWKWSVATERVGQLSLGGDAP